MSVDRDRPGVRSSTLNSPAHLTTELASTRLGLLRLRARYRRQFAELVDQIPRPTIDPRHAPAELHYLDPTERGGLITEWWRSEVRLASGDRVMDVALARGWLSGVVARYARLAQTSIVSIYELRQVCPGRGVVARDVLAGDRTRLISDSELECIAQPNRLMLAKLVTVKGMSVPEAWGTRFVDAKRLPALQKQVATLTGFALPLSDNQLRACPTAIWAALCSQCP